MSFIESFMLWVLTLTGQPGADPGHIVTPPTERPVQIQRDNKDEDEDEDDQPYSSVIQIDWSSKKISNGL